MDYKKSEEVKEYIAKLLKNSYDVSFPSGTCRVCECTEEHACRGGCSWVDKRCTICSKCKE
jgi:hypothetical protein